MGVDFKVWGESTSGQLAIVEHPMEPGRLVAPHVHQNEDELSYVLEGTFGVRIGDEVATVGPGTYIYKPRGIPHTFWNPGPKAGRLIELIWPAGFEKYFEALAEPGRTSSDSQDLAVRRAELRQKYNLGYGPEWVPDLKARFNLKLLGEP